MGTIPHGGPSIGIASFDLSLILDTNDLLNPSYEIVFFRDRNGANADGILVRSAVKEVDAGFARFQAILHSRETEVSATFSPVDWKKPERCCFSRC